MPMLRPGWSRTSGARTLVDPRWTRCAEMEEGETPARVVPARGGDLLRRPFVRPATLRRRARTPEPCRATCCVGTDRGGGPRRAPTAVLEARKPILPAPPPPPLVQRALESANQSPWTA